jgi:PAS domain S-box-containing protein
MRISDSNPSLVRLYGLLARSAALVVACLGAAVLAGWKLDIGTLKSVVPGWATMKPNTALGFLCSGIALLLVGRFAPSPPRRRLAGIVLAMVVTALGFLTVGEYLWKVDFGIDELLFAFPAGSSVGEYPARMSLATATAFACTGVALTCLGYRRCIRVSQAATLSGATIGLLAILGYAYGVDALYGIGAYSSMALHTAAAFLVINLATLLASPRHGLLAVITSETSGGVMARRLLPLSLVAPFVIGWLLVANLNREPVGFQFPIATLSLAYVVLFSTLVWRTASVLRASDLARREVEEARQKNQAQLAGIVDAAMDAIVMIDGAQRITLFNPAAEQMFGRKADDMLGQPLDPLIPQRYRESHGQQIRLFSLTGATNRRINGPGNLSGLRANGEEFPIDASISQLDVNGARHSLVILRDVTQRVRAEQALLESRRQTTLMIEQAPIAIAMFDRDMNYLAASDRWVADYGNGLATLAGLNHYDVWPDLSEEWKQVHRDGMAGIVTRNDSDLWIRPDGSRRWLRWAVHPWKGDNGLVGGIIMSSEDITPYKRTELALRASEDDLNRAQAVGKIGSWRLDVRRNELTWSKAEYRIFGIAEGTPLTYETFLGRVHPDDRAYVDSMWQAALSGKPYDIEHRLLVDGKVLWVREKAELELGDEGQVVGGFGITQDITARRETEELLKKANDRLAAVAAERAANLRELSAALTLAEQRERDNLYELLHDHVQPLLISVRLGLSGLGEHSPQQLMLQTVRETIVQISRVIVTLRTLSIELSPPLIRERGLVPALESLGRRFQPNYGLKLKLTHGPDTEPASMPIRLLCFNAVREALMNVVKHAGTQEVTLDLQREEPDMLRVVVRDHGAGFDPEREPGGSGLASLARKLGMVGGTLSVESFPGDGTIVTLRVPLETVQESQVAPESRGDSESATRGNAGAVHEVTG